MCSCGNKPNPKPVVTPAEVPNRTPAPLPPRR